MKIKRLDIHGFKSFVDKTTFNFPMGITAIVGPNGCGKSNIVDAIRWVLGEQNPRHLRGKLMEDIIFSGSEDRKPLGMAEVVLTLSNEEGRAPAEYINFTEIEIARRLYRSGESEYYINKVQCRLKDIVDLFTDTGIGTRAYSIVEQGQVAWVINSRPEERRVLFEEAAGINRYRQRKEASLRRLEMARQNLTRVQDIIGEVKRQINSFSRQAKKAERYKVLREELKGIELFLTSKEYNGLKEKRGALESEWQRLRDRKVEFSTIISQKGATLEDLKTRFLKEDEALRAIREKVFEIDRSIQKKDGELRMVELKMDELLRNETRLLKEMEGLISQKEGLTRDIQNLKQAEGEILSQIGFKANELKGLEESLQGLTDKLRILERGLDEKKAEVVDLMTRLAHAKNTLLNLSRDEEGLGQRLTRAFKERDEGEGLLAKKEGVVKDLKERMEGIVSELQVMARTRAVQLDRIKELENLLAEREGLLKTRKEEATLTSSRLQSLREWEENLDGLNDGARAIMLNKKVGSDWEGIHGLVADVIEVTPPYEKAVDAAMGERLQYIIVESQKEGVEAVEYLKARAGGRGSFIPLELKEKVTTSHPSRLEDKIEAPLIDLVQVKEGYHHIARYLLADFLLVKDLKMALELWRKDGSDKTIVTLDGEVVDAYGVITGGASNSTSILQRRREIKELTFRAEGLEERVRALVQEVTGLKERIKAGEGILEGLRDETHSKEIELVNIQGELKREEGEMTRLKERLNAINFECEDLQDGIKDISARKAELTNVKEGLEEGLKTLEALIKGLTEEMANLSSVRDVLTQKVTTQRVEMAGMKERLEGIRDNIERMDRALLELDMRRKATAKEIEKGREEMKTKEAEGQRLKEEMGCLLRLKDEVSRRDTHLEGVLNATSQEVASLEADLKGIKGELEGLQEGDNRLSLELKEIELNLIHLAERVNERYGVTIEDYLPSDDIKAMGEEKLISRLDELKGQIEGLGEVSLSAIEECRELENRLQFLIDQQTDLTRSVETLQKIINRINRTTRQRFRETFDAINQRFQEVFPRFFQGGRAELRLIDEGEILDSGIDVVAQPPGKRLQNINLLSGGEKALTAIALIFSIFLIKPSPFCLLDEVDAPLDDANIIRFNNFLKEMARTSQFILITHNKGTMEIADTLFGITMETAGVSKMVSVELV